MMNSEPVLRRGSPGSSRGGSSLGDVVARWTRTYTSPGCRRSARSARSSLIRPSSGGAAAFELSRQGLGPAAVDGPEHQLARARASRTISARPGDANIEILPAAVYDAARAADRAASGLATDLADEVGKLRNHELLEGETARVGRAGHRDDDAARVDAEESARHH